MKKQSRNDKCNCNSGKKYKHCCIISNDYKVSNGSPVANKTTDSFFSKYNSFDLLQSIAALTLVPENHGKNIRLEKIAGDIFKNYNSARKLATYEELKNYIKTNYCSHADEDIPVNLFTDSITFFGGDKILFPGITENGTFILSNLLTAMFVWPHSNIPGPLKSNSMHVCKILLTISDLIATKNSYTRYQKGQSDSEAVFFPELLEFEKMKSSVIFSQEEINSLLEENCVNKLALEQFILNPISSNFDNNHIEESPLLFKPVLFKDDKYLIVSPATISFAITDYIWKTAEKMDVTAAVCQSYHALVWNNLQLQIRGMKFDYIETSEISPEIQLPPFNFLYRFDDDKIALIQYIYDDGTPIATNFSMGSRLSNVLSSKQKEDFFAEIGSIKEFSKFKFFDFVLISPIGRDFGFSVAKVKDTKTVAMPVYEFHILANLKDYDAIDLWQFAVAREKQREKFSIMTFSFLDEFKLYCDHRNSFHLSDEQIFTHFSIEPGYSQEMYFESIKKTDIHSVPQLKEDCVVYVQVQKFDSYGPIYLDPMVLASNELEFFVEGFHQGIWVTPDTDIKAASKELRHMYWETNGAIAYWLWQIQNDIKSYLKVLGLEPITVSYAFDDGKKFEEIERNFTRVTDLNSKFKTEATVSSIIIIIPTEFIAYLYGPDNEGERILVNNIIDGFNKLLKFYGHQEISLPIVSKIIDDNVPLGMKKKFFILDTNDNLLLDPSNLIKFRYVQKYDQGVVIDQLVPRLGQLCPPAGELKTKKEKNDLTNNIVQKALLPLLREKLALYNSKELLEKLIALNESLIRKREEERIHTPTRIACYVSSEQHQSDLMEKLGNLNRTCVAVRSIIEHIAAEPYYGTNILSTTAIDELLGIMDQIIDWGSLGDQIHFDLLDIRMGILPTGRIGTDKEMLKNVFDPYRDLKTKENVHDAVENFQQVFPQLESYTSKDVPKKLDKAFIEDYGISFTRLCIFIEGLSTIAFLQQSHYAVSELDKLREQINIYVEEFEETEFQKAISFLSLENRGKLEKLPVNCEFVDIMPWRYNRVLSLLRKPLIIVDTEPGKNKLVYWGARQVLLSRMYLANQCLSDRLRTFEGSKIKEVLGAFAQKRGDQLVDNVIKAIDTTNLIVDRDVYIGPKHKLKNEILIGDIDVLIIDPLKKILYSIECKSMQPSRNIKEMVEEVDKLFGSDSELGWIGKHQRRHDWLIANRQKIFEIYHVGIIDFTIKSIFVTQEEMLTPHLKKQNLPMPFLTLYDVQDKGLEALLKV